MTALPLTAAKIMAHLQQGDITALETITATLERIQTHNDRLNCFTMILSESALETAADIDRRRLPGESLGPLADVPLAVENLDKQTLFTVAIALERAGITQAPLAKIPEAA